MTESAPQIEEPVMLAPYPRPDIPAQRLVGDFAKEVFDETKRLMPKYENPGFQEYREFKDKTGEIIGSNTPLCVLTNKVLRTKGLRLPTPWEARQLNKKGKLTNGVYREFGIAVYNDQQPNQELAKYFLENISKEAPFILPFSSLDLEHKTGRIILSDNLTDILSGKDAKDFLKREFDYTGTSGVCRLLRNAGGNWYAIWSDLSYSDVVGRMDWYCGEATRKKFQINIKIDNS